MIKKITLLAAIVLFAFGANAQIKVVAGGALALPTGDWGKMFKTSYGINVGAKYTLTDQIAAGVNIGYLMYQFKEDAGGETFTSIPVTVTGTYYLATEGFKPYVGADLGYYLFRSKYDGETYKTKYIGFAPTVGFEYSFSDKIGVDVNAKYNYVSTPGKAATYLGINFGLIYTIGQ
jgi:outer membrane protein W